MATLELVTPECHKEHDLVGRDEPIIKVDGISVWNGVIEKGRRQICVPPASISTAAPR